LAAIPTNVLEIFAQLLLILIQNNPQTGHTAEIE
jgi:hypothetical protein